jgi:type II secretory pathway pseudopilin PulG
MPRPQPARHGRLRAFTIVEMLVVIGIIAALVGILLPVLGIVRRNAELATSQANLRTVAAFLTAYSLDSRDHIVPSQFDYTAAAGRTVVRSASPANTQPNTGQLLKGSWTDILWTVNKLGPIAPVQDEDAPSPSWNYRYDSPDYWAYTNSEQPPVNPMRSKVPMTTPFSALDASDARPFGDGACARELGQPGYFAANDFFDARPATAGALGNWFTNAMIRFPAQAVYLVDSRAGETIPLPTATGAGSNENAWLPTSPACEVDFRYVGDVTCMLYLDAHVGAMGAWTNLADLANNRQTRIERLDQRN